MLSLFTELKLKIFDTATAYYNGEFYQHNQNWFKTTADISKKVLIVSPSFYTQTVKKYPISDRRELKKLLKLQRRSNHHYIIKHQDEQNIHVIHWQFDSKLPKALIYLPESLLVSNNISQGQVLEVCETEDKSYFFTEHKSSIFLAKKSALMNTAERFAISTGTQCDEVKYLSFDDKLELLKTRLSNLGIQYWLAFIPTHSSEQQNWWPLVVKSVLPATMLILLYSLASSAYLLAQNSFYSNKLNDQNGNLNQLLDIQQKIEQQDNLFAQLQAFMLDKPSYLPLWLELAPIFEKVDVDSIRIVNGRVLLRGETEQATAIMEQLTKSINVKDVKFDSPVSKTRRGERFNISFILSSTLILEDKFNSVTMKEGTSDE